MYGIRSIRKSGILPSGFKTFVRVRGNVSCISFGGTRKENEWASSWLHYDRMAIETSEIVPHEWLEKHFDTFYDTFFTLRIVQLNNIHHYLSNIVTHCALLQTRGSLMCTSSALASFFPGKTRYTTDYVTFCNFCHTHARSILIPSPPGALSRRNGPYLHSKHCSVAWMSCSF